MQLIQRLETALIELLSRFRLAAGYPPRCRRPVQVRVTVPVRHPNPDHPPAWTDSPW